MQSAATGGSTVVRAKLPGDALNAFPNFATVGTLDRVMAARLRSSIGHRDEGSFA